MPKRYVCCGDVVPGCTWTAEADSETELLQKVAVHAREHGLDDLPPDVVEKVKAAMRDR